ncbi:MAG TPA: hypothetical protein PKK00_08365 [Bacteroidales bacterium]|nr:hypothetical protein [Bacteroidales bacterium]HPS17203.1 hypothetical protein [Bacteroidales bacterium]
MKHITSYFILLLLSVNIATAQQNTLMEKRAAALENLDIFRGTISDSTKDVLKELVSKQNELIEADKIVVEQYLDSVKLKSDSLSRLNINLASENEMLKKEGATQKSQMLYVIIGGGILLLSCIVFIILYIIASKQKGKYRKAKDGLEKIKQDNLKEIELAKKEVGIMKASAQKEISAAKDEIQNEVKNLKAKIDSLSAEKSSLEKKAIDKSFESSQLQLQIKTIKEDYERSLSDLKSANADLMQKKQIIEGQISDKENKIKVLEKDYETLRLDLSDFKNLCERESYERKQLEKKLHEKENEIYNIDIHKTDELKNENDKLHEEIKQLNQRIEKEITSKKMIEEELIKFIEELKSMH